MMWNCRSKIRATGARTTPLSLEPLEHRCVLSASSALPGDYDLNNVVDQLDYEVWLSQFGAAGDALAADGNADGVVDSIDYAVWRENLGAVRENEPPMAEDDLVEVNHHQTAALIASQMLANDCDDAGALSLVSVTGAVGGTVELRDGVAFFTPDMGLPHGSTMSFEYTVADAEGLEATATVELSQRGPVHGTPGDEERANEHMALFSLIDTADATNVAVESGAWSDPAIWSRGVVPTAGERVLIHGEVEVVYDAQSDTPLDWVRVDGVLNFQTDVSTRMVVETIVSDPRGVLNIGTAEAPIDSGVTAEVLIDTTGGALSQVEDPTLIGRGFISHGRTSIFGAEKQEFTTLLGDASAGDAFIELSNDQIPDGWRVGDTLLLVGTEANPALLDIFADAGDIVAADADNARFRDELLEITNMQVIDGRLRVSFNNVTNPAAIDAAQTTLLWNHSRPDGESFDADELSIHVANLTRNVVVRSSDPTVDIQQRGHFMVMHNINADVHHAQLKDLGRTNKREVVDDPAVIGNFDGSPGTGTNARGRYGLHLHRLGANDLNGAAASITGNVVWGTPGWGIVHHDSHAVLEDNVVFDIAGAGIVAEDGNELGLWRNNLVVKATGDLVNNTDDGAMFATLRGPRFDLGFFGSGYWVQGGGFGVRMEDNIAASINAAGFDLVHNVDGLANLELISVDLIEDPVVRQAIADAGFDYVAPSNVPTRGIDGLVTYNSFRGIHTWLHNRDSGNMEGTFVFQTTLAHEFRSTIENYTIWGVKSGVQNFYSTRFDFRNGLVVGDIDQPVSYFAGREQQANTSYGVGVSHNHEEANKNLFDDLRLEGFEYGFQVYSPFNDDLDEITPYATSELRNANIANVEHAFISTNRGNPQSAVDRFSDLFILDEASTFNTLGSATNQAPTAAFEYATGEGMSVVLDAAGSFDPDPSPQVRAGDDGIAAYAWDLDGDGQFDDAYGRTLLLNFDAIGDYEIGLKVWDDDGATAQTTSTITVVSTPYTDPFIDGDFSSTGNFSGEFYNFWSGRRGEGWIQRNVARNPAGFAEIDSPQFGLGRFGQIIRNEHVHRGEFTFSFDLMNTNVATFQNVLQVRLYGVDGQWALDNGAPDAIFAMPEPNVATLLDVNLGTTDAPTWQNQQYTVDLGAQGYEYLVIAVEYQNYSYTQGDYFALDNFSLEAVAPAEEASSPLPFSLQTTGSHDAAGETTEGEPLAGSQDRGRYVAQQIARRELMKRLSRFTASRPMTDFDTRPDAEPPENGAKQSAFAEFFSRFAASDF